MTGISLTKDELFEVTGRKSPSKQIEALKKMGIAFFVTPANRPVVIREALTGQVKKSEKPYSGWQPKVSK